MNDDTTHIKSAAEILLMDLDRNLLKYALDAFTSEEMAAICSGENFTAADFDKTAPFPVITKKLAIAHGNNDYYRELVGLYNLDYSDLSVSDILSGVCNSINESQQAQNVLFINEENDKWAYKDITINTLIVTTDITLKNVKVKTLLAFNCNLNVDILEISHYAVATLKSLSIKNSFKCGSTKGFIGVGNLTDCDIKLDSYDTTFYDSDNLMWFTRDPDSSHKGYYFNDDCIAPLNYLRSILGDSIPSSFDQGYIRAQLSLVRPEDEVLLPHKQARMVLITEPNP